MIRTEFIVTGGVLVVLGFALLLVGYDKVQATSVENVVTFVEQVSGQRAPGELHPPKTTGYILLAMGGISLVAGLGFVLTSRKPDPSDKSGALG